MKQSPATGSTDVVDAAVEVVATKMSSVSVDPFGVTSTVEVVESILPGCHELAVGRRECPELGRLPFPLAD